MPDEKPTTPEPSIEAKKLILEDMGVPADRIQRLNTAKDIEEYMKYLETKSKKEEKTENKAPILQVPANAGNPPAPLPPPGNVPEVKMNMDLLEKLNPMSYQKAINNRWNADARVLPHITDDGRWEAF